jgi:hypothetical protein
MLDLLPFHPNGSSSLSPPFFLRTIPPGACLQSLPVCVDLQKLTWSPGTGCGKRSCGREHTNTHSFLATPSTFRPRARALHAFAPALSRPRPSSASACCLMLCRSSPAAPSSPASTALALPPSLSRPCPVCSHFSPLASRASSRDCPLSLTSALNFPVQPPLSPSSLPPRVGSVCCSLTRSYRSTHCAFSKLAFPVSKLRSLKLVRRYNQFTTWPAHAYGCTVFLDCLFSAGSLSSSDSWRSPCCRVFLFRRVFWVGCAYARRWAASLLELEVTRDR